LAEEVDDLVATVPEDELLRRESVLRAERLAQRVSRRVRIQMKVLGGRGDRLKRPRRGAERILIARQLDDRVDVALALQLGDRFAG